MGAIDIHAHGFPESFLRKLAHHYPHDVTLGTLDGVLIARWLKAPLPAFSVEKRLAEMDAAGVDVEILSAPVLYGCMDDATASLCSDLNDFQANVADAAPDRFRSFIHLPVHDIHKSLTELARWRDAPQVVGVVFGSNMGGVYPGESVLWPLWEAIAATDLPVFIHPVGPCGVSMPVMSPILMFPTDTAVAATSIVFSGLLDRFPELNIILSHYGGPLSALARRLDMGYENPGFAPGQGQDLPSPPSTYLPRFYVDTAQGYHRPGFECACAVFGAEHMLYGSDHFLLNNTWRDELNAFLKSLPLSAGALHGILRGNAEGLFRGWG